MESWGPLLTPSSTVESGTFFSTERFIQAVARASDADVRPVELCGLDGNPIMFGLEEERSYGRRTVQLAPLGLFAYPNRVENLRQSTRMIIAQLKTARTIGFRWNVRFDHADIANELQALKVPYAETTTHVLSLGRDYDRLFRSFSDTTRNQIRRAERQSIVVRQAYDESEISAYCEISERLAKEKHHAEVIYTHALFRELIALRNDVTFLVAELGTKVIAGSWFIRDGNSLFYWQSAMNYEYQKYFPTYAILAKAIRLACEDETLETLNMGGSQNILLLEQFKSFWGATKQTCWAFAWHNLLWQSLSSVKSRLFSYA
jgi:CelD/BcsL family acetyltransferase involved in cellulose biosynthesis